MGQPRMRFCLCACSIRRWAAAPFSLPRAASWPTLMKRRSCARAGSRQRTSPTRSAPGSAATVAQRCLYGVDINPMAVQLGRLSLWLATLVRRPALTFLDHRLRAGNSLVGAALVGPHAPGAWRRAEHAPQRCRSSTTHAVSRRWDRNRRADTYRPRSRRHADQVRAKEQMLAASATTSVRRSSAGSRLRPVVRRVVHVKTASAGQASRLAALADALFGRGGLPSHIAGAHLQQAKAAARRERFFHWTLEFPEVFGDTKGQPLAAPGFDAIVGNPPWEMLRGDRGERQHARSARRLRRADGLRARLRHLSMARGRPRQPLSAFPRDGYCPGAAAAAASAWSFRRGSPPIAARRRCGGRYSIARSSTASSSLDNRDGMFPVHRSLRFLLVSAVSGGRPPALPCRFGVGTADALDRLPDASPDEDAIPLIANAARTCQRRATGHARHPIAARCRDPRRHHFPVARTRRRIRLEHPFRTRAECDRRPQSLHPRRGRPARLSKASTCIPFRVDVGAAATRIPRAAAARLLDRKRTFGRAALAYREVASSTNRLTLIAAIIPTDVVTTHTLFCVKEALDEESQRYLCAVLNSFVANYFIRMRVSTHVSAGIIDRLRAPLPERHSRRFREIVDLSAGLEEAGLSAGTEGTFEDGARLQALVAVEYGVTPTQLQHILSTLPLLPQRDRDAALSSFYDIVS